MKTNKLENGRSNLSGLTKQQIAEGVVETSTRTGFAKIRELLAAKVGKKTRRYLKLVEDEAEATVKTLLKLTKPELVEVAYVVSDLRLHRNYGTVGANLLREDRPDVYKGGRFALKREREIEVTPAKQSFWAEQWANRSTYAARKAKREHKAEVVAAPVKQGRTKKEAKQRMLDYVAAIRASRVLVTE